MQLYQVTTREGDLVMNAPIETISRVFEINSIALSHVLKHTQQLGHQYWVHRVAPRDGWPETLVIERLPLEIPRPETSEISEISKIEFWEEEHVLDFLDRTSIQVKG